MQRTTNLQNDSNNKTRSSVNELILSGSIWQSGMYLAPMLSKLANEDEPRWLTLVLSDDAPSETLHWLKAEGINNNKVQILSPGNHHRSVDLACKALASGTSHTVISWIQNMDKKAMDRLESAARSGRCHGLTIRNRYAA